MNWSVVRKQGIGLAGKTILYQGPSGTTIDVEALKCELDKIGRRISFDWNSGEADAIRLREALGLSDESAVTFSVFASNGIGPLDEEQAPAAERIEGLARLLRRILPEPAKVIAHMSDVPKGGSPYDYEKASR